MKRLTKIFKIAKNKQSPTSDEVLTAADLNDIVDAVNDLITFVQDLDLPEKFVLSVNGETDDVEITAHMLGLGKVDNTDDARKPISNPTLTALNKKLDAVVMTNHLGTTNPHGLTYAHVGADPAGSASAVQAALNVAVASLQEQIDALNVS